MTIRDAKVALHRNARRSIKETIGFEIGADLYRTRIEKGEPLPPDDRHAWTSLYFCPYMYESAWVVGHSIYRVRALNDSTIRETTIIAWDCWNMSDLTSALRLFRYLNRNKEALQKASVELDPEPEFVAPKMANPLKRADQRAGVAMEFMNLIRSGGTSGRINDVVTGSMSAFVRGCTIDRESCPYHSSDWATEANRFTRYISGDQFNIDSVLANRLRDKARVLVLQEQAEAP